MRPVGFKRLIKHFVEVINTAGRLLLKYNDVVLFNNSVSLRIVCPRLACEIILIISN